MKPTETLFLRELETGPATSRDIAAALRMSKGQIQRIANRFYREKQSTSARGSGLEAPRVQFGASASIRTPNVWLRLRMQNGRLERANGTRKRTGAISPLGRPSSGLDGANRLGDRMPGLEQPHDPRCYDRPCYACWTWINNKAMPVERRELVNRLVLDAKGKVTGEVVSHVAVYLVR